MKLIHSPTSPYVRKVVVLLHETGLAGRVTLATVQTTPLASHADAVAANPLGKVPALERPDGPTLYDSRVITRYLDTLHDGARLYPEGAGLWSTLTLEALGDGMLDAGIAATYEWRLRPDEMQYAPWIAAQRGKICRALDALEAQWLAHLAGPLDMGVIAVACALGYLDFRFGDMAWRDDRPQLAAWYARFSERESWKATAPAA